MQLLAFLGFLALAQAQQQTPGFSVIQPQPSLQPQQQQPQSQAQPQPQPQQQPQTLQGAQQTLQNMGIDINDPKLQQQARQLLNSLMQQPSQPQQQQQGFAPYAPQQPVQNPLLSNPIIKNAAALLGNPKTQKYLKVVSDPKFAENITKLTTHPNRMLLLYCEIGLFFFLILFRAWKFSHVQQGEWISRLWIGIWTLGAYWALAAIALPTLILGDAFVQTAKGLFVLFQS